MWKRSLMVLVLAATVVGGLTLAAREGKCVFCPSDKCYNSHYCGSCTCMTAGGDSGGTCVSLQQLPDLGDEYTILE